MKYRKSLLIMRCISHFKLKFASKRNTVLILITIINVLQISEEEKHSKTVWEQSAFPTFQHQVRVHSALPSARPRAAGLEPLTERRIADV